MKKLNQKTVGIILAVFSVILLVILGWVKVDFDQHAVFLCEAVSTNPNLEMSQCPAHTSSIPWLLMVGFAVSGLILAVGSYLTLSPQARSKKTLKEVDLSSLNEEERTICNLLKEHNGSMYQSEIIKRTGFTKVKTTRLLDKLEHDDQILERKRRGMTNIVVLK